MATTMQKDRRRRAMGLIERRIAHWSEFDSDSIEYEGKTVNPNQKLAQAEFELAQIKSKP